MKKLLVLLAVSTALGLAQANTSTPIGTWQSIDDVTGKPSAEIKITDKGNGELIGVVQKALAPPKEGDTPNCNLCTDDRKDKPKLGMEIIRGAKLTSGTELWEGGTILDPNNGKTYKLRLTPLDSGTKLQVRGYIGVFFRTQTWIRVSP